MNRKQLRGNVRSFIGALEQSVGKLIGNGKLRRRGMTRRISGKTEALAGKAMANIKAAMRRD